MSTQIIEAHDPQNEGIALRVGYSYFRERWQDPIRIVSCEYKVFDSVYTEEDAEPEAVFTSECGAVFDAQGRHAYVPAHSLVGIHADSPQIGDDGGLYFELEVGKSYTPEGNSQDVTIVREWLVSSGKIDYHLFMGDNGHVYWSSGRSVIFPHVFDFDLKPEGS